MRAIITLMVTLALAGCASHGKPITQQQIDRIEEGKTTKQELLASFGKPIAVLKNSDGTEVIGWGYARIGFAGTSYQNQSISVTLDPDGKVIRYTTGSVGDSR
nr:hypothetical protein [uncultured Pseudomonas sp.]